MFSINIISAIWTLPFILLKLTNINLVVIKDNKNIINSIWNSLDN